MIEHEENSTSKLTTGNTHTSDTSHQVTERVWGMKDIFVNFYFIQDRESSQWVLVDTGLAVSKNKILKMSGQLFNDKPPAAIILTHGHFDHTGSVEALASHWHIPVYAHYLEFPYLSGKASYPPPDPSVGGGLMSLLSPFYKKEPIDISGHLIALPEDGSVPFLSEWKFLHTPGHAPGHISLFREGDRVLVAGDALVTTQPESLFATITQKQQISGPPSYFTYDWIAGEKSVQELAALKPSIIASGHGKPFSGIEMEKELEELARNFNVLAVPETGRYISEPAIADATGVRYIPAKPAGKSKAWLLMLGVVIIAITALSVAGSRKNYNYHRR
ncbi:MAG: MBL fold metallo-hydrolase [Chitinophagaceae bacterium]|nr:MAG: MBL fold metallo-hydrolase [Chitinophagaceae bacterium]